MEKGRLFVCDVHIPPSLVKALRERGFRAEHVHQLRLGTASDEKISHYAGDNHGIVVTKDKDFAVLATTRAGAPTIRIRMGNCPNPYLIEVFFARLPDALARIESGVRLVEIS